MFGAYPYPGPPPDMALELPGGVYRLGGRLVDAKGIDRIFRNVFPDIDAQKAISISSGKPKNLV